MSSVCGYRQGCTKLEGIQASSLGQAIRHRPDYAEAYNNLGAAQADVGRYEEAALAFEQAMRLKPGFALAHYNLRVAFLRVKNRKAALAQHKVLGTLAQDLADKLYGGIHQGRILKVADR